MKLTFRWYYKNDHISLKDISQIPTMSGIVASLYDVKPGIKWELEDIMALKAEINNAGLEFEVVESVPVHEDIKLGIDTRDEYILNYCETIRNLSKAGVKVICYNFMPVFDWMRSDLKKKNNDGSTSLSYVNEDVNKLNPLTIGDDLDLPAWDKSIGKEKLKELLITYQSFTEEQFFDNLKYFLDRIIPVAAECDVAMAIHPDDPPWKIFGLPRIIGNKDNLIKFLALNKSKYNGVTFCTGSFGSSPTNDLVKMIEMCKGRIHFAHLRNVRITGEKSFEEAPHPSSCGSIDMYEIVKALRKNGFDGYVRPDHGRAIWNDSCANGYGLYDRALGATYIVGLFEAIDKGVI